MKKNLFKRGLAGLLPLVMCLTALVGIGTTTAYAAGERAEVYLVSFPRSGDANIDYSGTWGHPNLRYMNGWHSGESKYTTIRAMHSYDGNICYCNEPGVQQDTGDTYTSKDETFWDNLPSDINSTISPYDMKLRIMPSMAFCKVMAPYVVPDCFRSHFSRIRPELRKISSISAASPTVQKASMFP